jgi:hypothetical protein
MLAIPDFVRAQGNWMNPCQSMIAAMMFLVPTMDASPQGSLPSPVTQAQTEQAPILASAALISASDVTAAVRQLSSKFTDDESIRVLEAGPNRLGLFVVGRPKKTSPPQVEARGAIKVTEGLQLQRISAVIQVLDGAGTFVTGGTLIDPQRMPPDDPDAEEIGAGNRGKAILGGQSHRISAGDLVIVPAGVPHGFSEIETPITYLVIRIDPGKELPLK